MADTPSRSLFARGLRLLRRRLRGLRWAAKRISGLPVHIHIESRWRLGDEILAIPFYRLVRERYPAATITVAVNHPELLEGNGDVSVDSNRSEFACDRHILATCEGRPETRLEHLCRIHRIPYRPLEPAIRPPEFAAGADLRGDPLIAVSTGAGWACKSWPAAHVARFARLLREALPDAVFVEVGKGCPTAGVGRSFIDALSVRETAAVLAKAALYVGPDSGLSTTLSTRRALMC